MVALNEIVYVVDENLLRLGKGMVAVRRDTGRFTEDPLDELLPEGINDVDWIPVLGRKGWVVITNDRRIRTRPAESQLAIEHRLKVVHLHGDVGNARPWDQLIRVTSRWEAVEKQVTSNPEGPWWLSLRTVGTRVMRFEPGKVER
ncbi:hypothetical protein FHT40_005384 [Mycolicibacterium sp. BK556]|uniref:PIN-like domain-containing protein n=1 Tax=unclassified Mycolicibacterium TaxID=2636767 RepID=UPI00161EC3CC|nr:MULTISPECIES: hypothetical protein [unclassified Mycolicibacterium]MBB3605697.1 hypothetical protein [Mycolicibacterium sp. BK556]MBB3635806.1 hypothetical protein [Mycolicibacterium sp. BK607]